MVHIMKPSHGRPIRSHSLRRPRSYQVFEQDVPRVYPFMLGYSGMGTVNPEEVMDKPAFQASPELATGTVVEKPLGETGQVAMGPSPAPVTSNTFQTPRTLAPSQTSPLSLPTLISTSSIKVSSIVATTSTPSTSLAPFTSSTPSTFLTLPTSSTLPPMSTSASVAMQSSSFIAAVTALATSETSTNSFSSTSSSSIEVTTSVAVVPAPTTASVAQTLKEKHPYALYVAFGLMVLILLGVICASIAWIIRRRRRKREEAENHQWIGSVLNDESDNRDGRELERGRDTVEPGMAGVGVAHREPTYPPLTPPLLSSWYFQDTPIPNNGNCTLGTHYGFTPAHVRQPWRHSTLLQRGGPAAIDAVHHGLDGNGLTFRQDPNGGLTFNPRGIDRNEVASYPNPHAPPTFVSTAPSHYSYGGAGPFAVTNLMPGDISSRASETSLGQQTSQMSLDRLIPPGLGNSTSGGPARSLGLPTGPLDDPNPWRRYQGVENRGGAIGTEDNDKGWGATIRSGIYSAVGRIVGGDGTNPSETEETKPVEREKDRFTELVKKRRPRRDWKAPSDTTASECDEVHVGIHYDNLDDDTDGATATVADSGRSWPGMDKSGDERPFNWLEREPARHMLPDSRGWIVEELPDGSRGKIHIVASGARDRILRRLGSNASAATWTTAYSTDTDPVFSSESGTTSRTNTIATSRRDTISTRKSGCVGMDRSREPSTTSSDWGTMSVAKALGVSLAGRTRDDRHEN
ncbi:hypothetical protein ACGC1H_004105 [Rhizoctonia solani]|uniref:Transmembrane protein n=1 Tax=Rhizoctonia solani TaxID=456999 RepID=A0A8H3GWR8_9AGAM|nr:unnamed protein product [Rhizoctonia solani]